MFKRIGIAALVTVALGGAFAVPQAVAGTPDCTAVHKYGKAYISQTRVHNGLHQFKVTHPVVWVCDGKIVGIAGGSTSRWVNFIPQG